MVIFVMRFPGLVPIPKINKNKSMSFKVYFFTILSAPFLFLIRLYQLFISPCFLPSCRFYPTCSHYAFSAYKKFNFIYASYLSFIRILKCHPLGGSGFDPLPRKYFIQQGENSENGK